ncbi:hypothetical protein M409DRAFT_29047 [Zasmidium cellare ATCC 36951]|uniref:Uncharacterized protein n=1 Tax=Zasmidium cellare ATCC 36951 TaxID=1080233 RepID=A0A6A6C043_ZASCE|nr:uncharacterized protein M409DRAFT_29047 [Zasmidium cellare ATCC 36951]KAF2160424.1 hypothetical protein M409DRAFT_29047 [Zasmidium cellare ATCC 36951]
MDVHRSRFVPYPSSAITAVAFSRSSNDGLQPGQPQPALKLAIGRSNGQIEIWNPQGGKWCQETIFPGGHKSIDGLVWTREADEKDAEGQIVLGQHRLFSIASSPDVTEWDLERGEVKRKSTGNFSEVWCFAAQPRASKEGASQEIVAGCGNGAIVLLTTEDSDLQFKKFVARVSGKKAQCMSITYQTPTRVVAGFGDSSIRVFDTRNGSVVRSMSVGAGVPGAPKNSIVWQVKCLPNGDIVSGDSNGEIVFWDARSCSLSQRIKGHDSECLDLIASADGKTIISGSLDGRLAVFRQSMNMGGRMRWAKSHHRRTHEGEIKSMSAFDSDGLSVVVSGGPDLVPVVTPLRENGKENYKTLPELPQQPHLVSARHARLLVSWYENTISVWRIARKPAVDPAQEPLQSRKLVAKIVLHGQSTIRSVSMSEDGRVLAASTDAETKVFQLRRRSDVEALGVRKLDIPSTLASSGARLVGFSPDGKWLTLVTLDNEVYVARLTSNPSKPKQVQIINKVVELERQHRPMASQSALRNYEQTITRVAFASDSSVLVASDNSGHLDSWVLEGHEDPTAPAVDVTKDNSKKGASEDSSDDSSDDDDELCVFYGQHWTENPAGHLLPNLDSMPLVLSFRPMPLQDQQNGAVNGNPGVHATRHNPHAHSHELPKGQHRLWIMTAKHQMYEFEVLTGKLNDWSRANPTSILPEDFTKLKDRVMGAVWDVTSKRERLWLYGCSWMFMFDVSPAGLSERPSSNKKRNAEQTRLDAKRQKTSGAGSKMISSHREGLPESIKRYEDGAWTDVSLDRAIKPADDESDQDEEVDARLRLTRLRAADGEDQQQVVKSESQSSHRPWWCTFKYRHILGVVPLVDDASVDDERPLEVAVVERPPWEALKAEK